MFNTYIHDYYELFNCIASEKGLILHTGLELLLEKQDQISYLYNIQGRRNIIIDNDGLWIDHSDKDEISFTKFVDIFNKNVGQKDLPFSIAYGAQILSDYVIGIQRKHLYVYRRDDQDIKTIPGRFNSKMCLFKGVLVAREVFADKIQCFDLSLNEIWSLDLEKQCFTSTINSGIQPFNDIFIVNVGERTKEPRGEFELNAYRIEDGGLVWQVILPATPYCSNVIGDKVYISVRERIIVVDSGTGKILVDVPHQLGSDGHHNLYPFKDYLIAACETTSKINVFSKNGQELLQQIDIPEPLSTICRRLPVACDDKLYILLSHRNMIMREASSSLLVLKPDESQPHRITLALPRRPPFYISVLTKKNGDHEHLVTISHPDLDEIILYGTIVLKEIVIEVSSQLDQRKRDENHNGTLHFVVDPDPLPKDMLTTAREKLQVIADRIDWHTKRLGETAGKNKKPFKVLIDIK
jgi:hypothetical protein